MEDTAGNRLHHRKVMAGGLENVTGFIQSIRRRRRGGRAARGVVVAVVGVAALVAAAQVPVSMRARSVWYPRYDDSGQMTAQVFGESAEVQADGSITVTGFKMELFTDGVTDVRIIAEECVYRPQEGKASSESNVVVERKNVVISGRGFKWDSQNHIVEIHENTRVVLRNIRDLANEPETR